MRSPSPAGRPARVVSVDVLRGITVAFMILVNTAGDSYAAYGQLRHSVWNGCTLTDLVFPTFLFLMGVAIAFSKPQATFPIGSRMRKVSRRAAILILIGLALNALPWFSFSTLRYCGVLQRIGITYFLAMLLYLFLDVKGLAAICGIVLAAYWGLLTLAPVPGFRKTGLELGVLNPVANLACAVDRLLIPQQHLYHHSFYDPEGILSTFPATISVLLGILAGRLLKGTRLRPVPAACTGASLALAGWLWGWVFPWNKRMWTSSFVLWSAGIDFLLLSIFSWWLDGAVGKGPNRWGSRLWKPWLAFGSNSLATYILSEVFSITIDTIPIGTLNAHQWAWHLLPASLGSPAFRSLMWSLAFTSICFIPVYLLYRKQIVIKL